MPGNESVGGEETLRSEDSADSADWAAAAAAEKSAVSKIKIFFFCVQKRNGQKVSNINECGARRNRVKSIWAPKGKQQEAHESKLEKCTVAEIKELQLADGGWREEESRGGNANVM